MTSLLESRTGELSLYSIVTDVMLLSTVKAGDRVQVTKCFVASITDYTDATCHLNATHPPSIRGLQETDQ